MHEQSRQQCGRKRASGISIIWLAIFLTALCGIVSLAVDYGRVQLVKTELRSAADAAALAGAAGMNFGTSQAQTDASNIAAANRRTARPWSWTPAAISSLARGIRRLRPSQF
jgi:uncharacterized membrane protein